MMKTVGIFCCYLLLTCNTLANLYGSDDFNDSVIDSTKWLSSIGTSLSETNGRLECAGGPGEVVEGLEWIANKGSYVHDWSVSIDVVNAVDETSLSDQEVRYAMVAWNVSPYDNTFFVGLVAGDDAGGSNPYRYVETSAEHGHAEVFNQQTSLSADSTRLRMAFDSTSKILTSYYDTGGGMTVLASYDASAWGMADSDDFTIAVAGLSVDVSLASGEVYGDNFAAIPEPGTLSLLTLAAGCLYFARRQRRKQ